MGTATARKDATRAAETDGGIAAASAQTTGMQATDAQTTDAQTGNAQAAGAQATMEGAGAAQPAPATGPLLSSALEAISAAGIDEQILGAEGAARSAGRVSTVEAISTGLQNGEAGGITPTTHGYTGDQRKIIARLSRIEGQVHAIKQMTQDGEYCIDILTQIAAASSALKSVALLLLDDHMEHCVRQAAQMGGEEADAKIAEANAAIARLVKS